jgi:septal ring factor EnvC (AmiA/AmiB activator)
MLKKQEIKMNGKNNKRINKKLNGKLNIKLNNIIKINVFLLTLVFVYISFFSSIVADTVTDKKQKSSELKEQVSQNNEEIANKTAEANEYIKQIDTLDKEIATYSSELDELQKKIDEINQTVKNYEASLQNSSQKYNSAQDVYTTRIRAIYENGIPNVMDLLVTSQGVSDFFSRMNVYSSVLDYDKSLIGNIQSEKEYTDNIKKEIETEKLQIDQLNYDKEKTASSLEKVKSSKESKVTQLNASKEKLEEVNKIINEEVDKLDKQVEQEIARQQAAAKAAKAAAEAAARKNPTPNSTSNNTSNSSISAGSGQFTWPTPGHTRITAYFPYYPSGERHTGIDMGIPIGTPIYAASSGMVIKSTYYIVSDRGGSRSDGYGNTVWISDGTYTVIYGHLQYRKVVNYGDYVQRGQLIAYSASTGNSTGPHLHFEIRKNGVAINPLQFF